MTSVANLFCFDPKLGKIYVCRVRRVGNTVMLMMIMKCCYLPFVVVVAAAVVVISPSNLHLSKWNCLG